MSLKSTTKSYKNKTRVDIPKEDWIRFENTHPYIVKQEQWDLAHKVRETKKRPRKNMDTPNMFSGLMFCGTCGKHLVLHRAHTMDEKKNNFACSTYKKKGKSKCSSHYITERQISAIVLDDMKRVTHFARQKTEEFIAFIARKSTAETRKQIATLSSEIEVLRKRNAELDSLFKRLYEDNVLGKIPNEVFRKLSEDYLDEQKAIKIDIPKKEKELENLKNSLTNTDKFIERAKEYSDLSELTPKILRQFIDKIVVYEKETKYSRTANQKVEIFYRDIGYLGDYTKESDIEEKDYDFEMLSNGDMIAVELIAEPA